MEVEVGDLPVPGAEHPERVEDDGHAGEPHDGVGRLERRLHAAPHHAPRHADADAAVADRSKTCAAPTAQQRLPLVGSAGSSVGPAHFFVPRTKRASGGRRMEAAAAACACGRSGDRVGFSAAGFGLTWGGIL